MQISDYLSREDIARFTVKSDWHAWRLVLTEWVAIVAIFAVVGRYPNVITIPLALILLGGRQMGLSVLMHEAGHRTLFTSARLNDVIGQWFCALPVFNDMPSYARGHLEHHRKAGTHDDPDLPNYQAYPVSRDSFKRKVKRDLTGQTGYKLLSFIARGASGALSRERSTSARPFLLQLLVQAIMIAVLAYFGMAWAYLL